MRRPLPALAAVAAAVLTAPACTDDGRVIIAFDPPVGAELSYTTEVVSTTAADLSCQPTARRTDRTVLDAHHVVLEPDDDAVRVEVALSRPGIGTRTFVMRFDRAAQLTAVEQVEGIPAAALGDLGLSEIFPAAAGAPPAEPLAPGDRWRIDDEISLGEGPPTRLEGVGRLVGLGVEDGRDTATVVSSTRLPVRSSTVATSGTRSLDGEQRSDVEAVYDLDTGALVRATAETAGTFALVLGPPEGTTGEPCAGRLTVALRSTITRSG